MAGQMFGEISNPSIKVGSQKWYTVPGLNHRPRGGDRRRRHRAVAGFADVLADPDTDDDGLRRGATTTTTTTSSSSTARGCRSHCGAGDRCEPERRADRSAGRDRAGDRVRPHERSRRRGRRRCRRRCRRHHRGDCSQRRLRRPRRSSRCGSAATSARHVKTKNVDPRYPEVARAARVAGIVILEAVIGPDGRVTEVKVLRSVPLLDAAAVVRRFSSGHTHRPCSTASRFLSS